MILAVGWRRIPQSAGILGCLCLGGSGIGSAQPDRPPDRQPAWLSARPDYRWSFPRDHWSHPGFKTEWWYFTGQLVAAGDSSRRFGYQFTFFRVGVLPGRPELRSDWAASDVIMGHVAITDLRTGRHRFSEVVNRVMPVLGEFTTPPQPQIAWSRAPGGTDARWSLTWNGTGFDFAAKDSWQRMGLALSTRPRKPMVLQGPNGFSRKGRDSTAASLYYSFTRLATEGTLTLDDTVISVNGESWMDKEFGSNQLAPDQVGWDWFSLRLGDGRDLMLYLLRRGQSLGPDGQDQANAPAPTQPGGKPPRTAGPPDRQTAQISYASGTVVSRDGSVRFLGPGDFSIRSTATWQSPATDARYPARWRVEVPSERLTIEVIPDVANQENRSALIDRLYYWEGSVSVRGPGGERVGTGYVELTGYGDSSRPAI